MNDALRIQISAFVDGELPDNESELLLRRLSQDTVLRQQVAQYLEIGRLIRNDDQVPGMDELRGRIAATLGDEISEHKSEQEIVGSRLMTPATGVAVAATVAALALVGLSQLDSSTGPNFDGAVAIDSAAGPSYTEPAAIDVLADSPNEQIQEYYRLHENSSNDFARWVNFELREGQLVEIEPDQHLSGADRKITSDEEITDSDQEAE